MPHLVEIPLAFFSRSDPHPLWEGTPGSFRSGLKPLFVKMGLNMDVLRFPGHPPDVLEDLKTVVKSFDHYFEIFKDIRGRGDYPGHWVGWSWPHIPSRGLEKRPCGTPENAVILLRLAKTSH